MLSIIMPSFCPALEKIITTVSLLLKQDTLFEIMLVLQQTPDNTVYEIRETIHDSRLVIIEDDGVGISRARNIGIEQSQGDWLLFLDDDIQLEEEVLTRFANGEEFSGEKGEFFYGNLFESGTKKHYLNFPLTGSKVGFFSYNRICSVILVIKTELFKKVGPFDERIGAGTFFGAYEEADLIVQALLEGVKIKYLEYYTVYHESADYEVEKTAKYARGTGAFYRKYWFKANLLLDLKFVLDLLLRAVLIFTLKKKRLNWFKGFIEGYVKFGKQS